MSALSKSSSSQAKETDAAAAANISCRFALVHNDITAVNTKVDTHSTMMIPRTIDSLSPADAPRFILSRMYTGMMKSAKMEVVITSDLIIETRWSILSLLRRMTLEVCSLFSLSSSVPKKV